MTGTDVVAPPGDTRATDAATTIPDGTGPDADASRTQHDADASVSPDVAPVIGDCGSLGTPGTWQQVWLPQSFLTDQQLETSAVAVDPHDQSVYVAAGSYTNGGQSGSGVYRSTDCGATFSLVSTGTHATDVAGGDPWVLHTDPTHPGTVYILVGYGSKGVYESTDQGTNWSVLNIDPSGATADTNPFPQALAIAPNAGPTLALTFHENCNAPFATTCFSRSTNGGATWADFNGPPNGGGWQEASSMTVLGTDTYLFLGANSGPAYTNDGGTTWSVPTFTDASGSPMTISVQESYGGSTHATPDGTLYLATGSGVFRSTSTPPGTAWTLLANSPASDVLIDDGSYMYASDTWWGSGMYGNGNGQVFSRAPLSNLTQWQQMQPTNVPRGSYEFAADSIHHIVYSANMIGGLWRLVTQ